MQLAFRVRLARVARRELRVASELPVFKALLAQLEQPASPAPRVQPDLLAQSDQPILCMVTTPTLKS